MQTNVFPSEYNRMVNERTNIWVREAKQRGDSRIQSINSSRTPAPKGDAAASGWMIGLFGGFIPCTCVNISTESMGTGFGTWVAISIICVIIGVLIDEANKSSYEENQANLDSRVKEEEIYIEKEISKIKSDAQIEKNQYFNEFEKNAQNLSVQFAESELAKEVIEWMTNGFCNSIDAADRRSHVEVISIPFAFDVLSDKIRCNLGTYDFELKRCRNLNNPLEQTALARAIVSAIQLNIIMKYPKDISGTDISIEISYSYTDEWPKTNITYVAPNGNYEAVRSW